VKQQCVFKQFIAINDKVEMLARDFISNRRGGKEGRTAERQRERERVSVRGIALRREGDGVSNKIDC
jgi:hypothetical protein